MSCVLSLFVGRFELKKNQPAIKQRARTKISFHHPPKPPPPPPPPQHYKKKPNNKAWNDSYMCHCLGRSQTNAIVYHIIIPVHPLES